MYMYILTIQQKWTCHMSYGWFLHFLSQDAAEGRPRVCSLCISSLTGISLRVSQSHSALSSPSWRAESSSDTTHHLLLSLSTVILQIFLLAWQNCAYGEACVEDYQMICSMLLDWMDKMMITQTHNAGYWRVMQPWQDHNCVSQSQDGWTRAGALGPKLGSAGIQTDSPSARLPQSTQSSDNVFLPGYTRRRTADQRLRRERALCGAQWRGEKWKAS